METPDESIRRVDSWLPGLGLWLVLLLTALAYWPGMATPFYLDDMVNLESLAEVSDGNTGIWEAVSLNRSGPLGRPVSMLSFVADWVTDPGSAAQLKRTNILLHLVCGALLFWLAGRLLAVQGLTAKRAWYWALWVAACWLAAPLFVSTTLYVVQRMTQLAALFSLCGLLTYVLARPRLGTWRSLVGLLLVVGLWWPLAALSKENGALLPLLILVVEAYFFRFSGDRRSRRVLAVFGLTTLVLPALAVLAFVIHDPGYVSNAYAARDFTLGQRLLTETRVLFDYLGALLLPRLGSLGFYHDDLVLSTGPFQPVTTVLALVVWAVIAVVAWWRRSAPWAVALFGPVFFLAGHAIESTAFPLEIYFEHRNYLPGMGIFLGLALLFAWAGGHVGAGPKRVLLGFSALLPVIYLALTWQQVQTWRDLGQYYLSTYRAHPESPRLLQDFSYFAATHGDDDAALALLGRFEALRPKDADGALLQRFLTYCLVGRPAPDVDYRRLAGLSGVGTDAYVVSGFKGVVDAAVEGRCGSGFDLLRWAEAADPWVNSLSPEVALNTRWMLLVHLGKLYMTLGYPERSYPLLSRARALQPERLEAGILEVQFRMGRGDFTGAATVLAEVRRDDHGQRPSLSRALDWLEQALAALRDASAHPPGDSTL